MRKIGAAIVIWSLANILPVQATTETWACTIGGDERPNRLVIDGNKLTFYYAGWPNFPYPYDLLQNTEYGIVAVWSEAKDDSLWAGHPSIFAVVIMIDKHTGKLKRWEDGYAVMEGLPAKNGHCTHIP